MDKKIKIKVNIRPKVIGKLARDPEGRPEEKSFRARLINIISAEQEKLRKEEETWKDPDQFFRKLVIINVAEIPIRNAAIKGQSSTEIVFDPYVHQIINYPPPSERNYRFTKSEGYYMDLAQETIKNWAEEESIVVKFRKEESSDNRSRYSYDGSYQYNKGDLLVRFQW